MPASIGLTEILILLIFFLAPFILCVISLVDILKSRFEGNNKIIWVLAVILLPFAGALFYMIVGKKQKSLLNKYN
jgi:hypothetical protein